MPRAKPKRKPRAPKSVREEVAKLIAYMKRGNNCPECGGMYATICHSTDCFIGKIVGTF